MMDKYPKRVRIESDGHGASTTVYDDSSGERLTSPIISAEWRVYARQMATVNLEIDCTSAVLKGEAHYHIKCTHVDELTTEIGLIAHELEKTGDMKNAIDKLKDLMHYPNHYNLDAL
jgi:GTPase SAR1 family protein